VQVTNDIFTREDGEFLVKHGALAAERITAVETGGCPHAAIREDISINLGPLEELSSKFSTDILLCESGGGNLISSWKKKCSVSFPSSRALFTLIVPWKV
jgi:urease accessory protein